MVNQLPSNSSSNSKWLLDISTEHRSWIRIELMGWIILIPRDLLSLQQDRSNVSRFSTPRCLIERQVRLPHMILFRVSSIVDCHVGLVVSTPEPWRAISFGMLNSQDELPNYGSSGTGVYNTPRFSFPVHPCPPRFSTLIPVGLCFFPLPLWGACEPRQSGPSSCRVKWNRLFERHTKLNLAR
jgi:hypothetical protein